MRTFGVLLESLGASNPELKFLDKLIAKIDILLHLSKGRTLIITMFIPYRMSFLVY